MSFPFAPRLRALLAVPVRVALLLLALGVPAAARRPQSASLRGWPCIAAGTHHTVALKGDGTVAAWGDNSDGQTSVPAGLVGVAAVAAGHSHTAVLKSDGTVVSWGNNADGQAAVPDGLSGVVALAAGAFHTVALKDDGTVVAWGRNTEGQATVPAGLVGVAAIAAGGRHSVALLADGTVRAWGANDQGQCGVPAGLGGVIAIAAGQGHTVILKVDGTVLAWGDGTQGQTAVLAGHGGVVAIAAGASHTVALTGEGKVVVWGAGASGQVEIPAGLRGVMDVAAGGDHTVALKSDWSLVAWGADAYGQSTVPAFAGPRMTAVAGGGRRTAVLQGDGSLAAWGLLETEGLDELGVPAGLRGVTAISASTPTMVALKDDGSVVAWGANSHGQTSVPAGLGSVKAIAAGPYHTLALRSDGTVTGWGDDVFGQCSGIYPPAEPVSLTGMTAIAVGEFNSFALKSDGTVVAWGFPLMGMLDVPEGLAGVTALAVDGYLVAALKSDGTVVTWGGVVHPDVPPPSPLDKVTAISVSGGGQMLALKSDGTVVAWGTNSDGQANVPSGLRDVKAIAGGVGHAVALTGDGSLVAWGANGFGQTIAPATVATLRSGLQPSVAGEPVPFTATVAPAAPWEGTPAGNVTFTDGTTSSAPIALAGGAATWTSTSLAGGVQRVTATFQGDGTCLNSTASLTGTVAKARTATSLASSPNPAPALAAVAFTATVAPLAPSAGTPRGRVDFHDGAILLGSASLAAGVATYTTSGLAIASHGITASYAGDSSYMASSSPILAQGVTLATPGIVLGSSASPATYGSPVTFTVAVAAGAGTPTGTVSLFDGPELLGSLPLASGAAAFATSALAVATHSITAVYGGDANFGSVTSSVLSQVVVDGVHGLVLGSSANPSVFGGRITFTASVLGRTGAITGKVDFFDGTVPLGSQALASGAASCSTSALGVGTHAITAVYVGDSLPGAAAPSPLQQVVVQALPAVALASSANPATLGTALTLTATVSSPAGPPTGSVDFLDGAVPLGTAVLASGVATLTTSSLTAATHAITAAYGGDASFARAGSAVLPQWVSALPVDLSLALATAGPTHFGERAVFTAQVAGSSGTPEGSVVFMQGAAVLATVPLAGGTAVFGTTGLALGDNAILARFDGHAYGAGVLSSSVNQAVSIPALVVAALPAGLDLKSGGTASAGFTLGALGTLAAPVTLSAAGLPQGAVCGFSSNGVDVSGGPATMTLTISAIQASLAMIREPGSGWPAERWAGMALLGGGVFVLPARRRRGTGVSLLALAMVLMGFLLACGRRDTAKPASGIPAGTYAVIITATAQGASPASSTLHVTVTP